MEMACGSMGMSCRTQTSLFCAFFLFLYQEFFVHGKPVETTVCLSSLSSLNLCLVSIWDLRLDDKTSFHFFSLMICRYTSTKRPKVKTRTQRTQVCKRLRSQVTTTSKLCHTMQFLLYDLFFNTIKIQLATYDFTLQFNCQP